MDFTLTIWSLLPPLIAIVLALITKEVYSSLFIGILCGGLLYTGFNPVATMEHVFTSEKGMIGQLTDGWNMGILIFLVVLGMFVILINRAGGSAAFGRWATEHIHSRVGIQLASMLLGCLIFIDDYFNCLTVGSVMRPVSDKACISRAKLAYLIDSTAAPICIIAPISSWAAAVAGFVDGVDSLELFIRAIPYNFYALLTIVMVAALTLMKFDYGPMRLHEQNAILNGDLTTSGEVDIESEEIDPNPKGRVIDLVLPIAVLIFSCIVGMIYTGGFFDGASIQVAFSDSDASAGLVYGSTTALMITILYFFFRRVLSFKDCMRALPEGFKSMVPAILILTMAWTLKGMTDSLGAADYVAMLVEGSAEGLMSLLPAIIFAIACFLSFSTGTSWGTFGILIPIVTGVFEPQLAGITDNAAIPSMVVICIAACLAGAVCGDHCSPISDTTIMASAGAKSDHVNHVSTQLPYALTVAAVSLVGFLLAGFVQNVFVVLGVSLILMIGVLTLIYFQQKKKA